MTYRIITIATSALALTALTSVNALADGPEDFATLDANADAQVTFKEYEKVAKRDYGMDTTAAAQTFTKLAGDDTLTEDELIVGLAKMDSNPLAEPKIVMTPVQVAPAPVETNALQPVTQSPISGIVESDTAITSTEAPAVKVTNDSLVGIEMQDSPELISSAPVTSGLDTNAMPSTQGTIPSVPKPTVSNVPEAVTDEMMDIESNTEVPMGLNTDTSFNPDLELNLEPDVETDIESDIGVDIESDIETEVLEDTPETIQNWD